MAERVVITGLGLITSLGTLLDDFWKNLTAGVSGISMIEAFDTSGLQRHYGGEIKEINCLENINPKKFYSFPRTHQLSLVSSLNALKDSGIDRFEDMGLAMGTLGAGLEFVEGKTSDFGQYPSYMLNANICNSLGLKGSSYILSCACASGSYALNLAYEKIRRGQEEKMLAGGADFLSLITSIGFRRLLSIAPLKCQPFDKNRQGLIPAEGAGSLVLENLDSAKKRRAHIYAEILGYGLSCDAFHSVKPSEEGIFNCLQNSLQSTGLGINDIDYINAHGTGTEQNDKAECKAIKRLFGRSHYKKIPVSSVKSMLGHTMGAASAIESVVCALVLDKGIIPPTINYETPDPECDIDCVPNYSRKQKVEILLNNSFGFGGINCVLIMKKYEE